MFAVGGPSGEVALYDSNGKIQSSPPGGSGAVEVMALSNGKLAYARAQQPTLEVWDLKSRSSAGRITLGELGKEADRIYHQAVLWSDGHSAMVSRGAYAYVGGKQAGHLNFLAYGPGSRLFANDDRGQMFWLQDAPLKVLGTLPAVAGGYRTVAVSADGKRVAASTSNEELLIFDVAERKRLSRVAQIPGLKHISFSPDGSAVAVCGTKVHLVEAASGESLAEWPVSARRVRFRADGQWLAAYGNESRIWEVASLKELSETGGFQDLDFVGNTGQLLAIAYDKVLLYDAINHKTVAEMPGFFDRVTLSPDGKLATLAPRNAKLQLWKLP